MKDDTVIISPVRLSLWGEYNTASHSILGGETKIHPRFAVQAHFHISKLTRPFEADVRTTETSMRDVFWINKREESYKYRNCSSGHRLLVEVGCSGPLEDFRQEIVIQKGSMKRVEGWTK